MFNFLWPYSSWVHVFPRRNMHFLGWPTHEMIVPLGMKICLLVIRAIPLKKKRRGWVRRVCNKPGHESGSPRCPHYLINTLKKLIKFLVHPPPPLFKFPGRPSPRILLFLLTPPYFSNGIALMKRNAFFAIFQVLPM